MHTIVILSDTLTADHPSVQKVKELFPECNLQILSKTAKESASNISPHQKAYLPPYGLNN